jgi:hypothetical protein
MKLWSLNRVFTFFGFRLVIEIGGEETLLYFVTNKEWKRRANSNYKQQAKPDTE